MRGGLLPCPGLLSWLWHPLVLLVQPLNCKGLPFSLPSLHPSRPSPGKASGSGRELFFGGFSIRMGSGGVISPAVVDTVLLLSACVMS